ncbi:hypothetical protein [Mesorhizobium sp. M0968]|uniref:hypothetical protein n=1 Tax=Mesorhizobium sp. M0968 TaxID=2957037 RepID=UPI003339E3AA
MSIPDCVVCEGRRYLNRSDIPFCEPCEPLFAAHVVSMQTDPKTGEALAVCPCSWASRHPWSKQGRQDREAAVIEHWRSVRRVRP